MAPNNELLYRELVIVNELGLHARSAAKLAKLAQQADKEVWVHMGDQSADAKQVIDLLTLGAARGDHVRVAIETSADIRILNEIEKMFADGFGE